MSAFAAAPALRPWRAGAVLSRPRSARRVRAQAAMTALGARPRLAAPAAGRTRLICVGDMHDAWGETDEAALRAMAPDAVLFVGDYGNENVGLVRRLATFADDVDFFVAAVLGNHDGFFSMSQRGRDNCPYNASEEDRVREQLELLRKYNPSYKSLDVHDAATKLSVVGGRPLTWGGPYWKHARFYRDYFNVYGMSQSAAKIEEAAVGASHGSLVFLSHNGPTGLGRLPSDPCGKDWGDDIGGDYGDEDLRNGIAAARRAGRAVPLVVFGHMHHRLRRGGMRTMLKMEEDGSSGRNTIMLDAAVVPRHRKSSRGHGIVCQFTVVELDSAGGVDTVEQVWATGTGEIVESTVLLGGEDIDVRPHSSQAGSAETREHTSRSEPPKS